MPNAVPPPGQPASGPSDASANDASANDASAGAAMPAAPDITDPEFCEREYNVRAALPHAADTMAKWGERARAARARLREAAGGVHSPLELVYGPADKERMDFFPVARPDEPLLVFIHGGYWRSMDKDDFSWIAPAFVARGVAVAIPNYDLVPGVPMETIVRQMLAALSYLWRNAPQLRFDRRRIVVAGHSAGGHLAAMMGCALWPQWSARLPPDLVRAVLTISGLHELEPLRHAPFLARDIALDAARAARMSPARMPPAPGVRLVTAVGGDESSEFHRQARLLAEGWPDAFERDVPMPGCDHFRVCERLAEPDSALFHAALELCMRR